MNAPIGQLALARYTLDDRYRERRVFLTGTQALVRLLINQKIRDQAAGLNTAGFVSGYRGSPLGGLDKELWRAQAFLRDHAIVFQPGVNEDLAATAVWERNRSACSRVPATTASLRSGMAKVRGSTAVATSCATATPRVRRPTAAYWSLPATTMRRNRRRCRIRPTISSKR